MTKLRPASVPSVPVGANFRFGESPFHVKGVLYQGTHAFFNDNLKGGMETLISEIDDQQLCDFIRQPFLASAWYDVMPAPVLIAYEAHALRMTIEEYLHHRTRYQAKRDLGGVYGAVLRVAPVAVVAARLPGVMVRMFDFVQSEITRNEHQALDAMMHGIPLPLEPWLRVSVQIYSDTALKLAGARTVEMERPHAVSEGERAGVRLVGLPIKLRWS
ncbi:MAG: hypothetical protein HOW73_42320 [Polyangiaceae bacterium]|nr:hypothetical protein [Polyangiaceae bacterium]